MLVTAQHLSQKVPGSFSEFQPGHVFAEIKHTNGDA